MTKHVEGQAYVGGVQGFKVSAPKYDANGELKEESAVVVTIKFRSSDSLVMHLADIVSKNESVEVAVEPVQRALPI